MSIQVVRVEGYSKGSLTCIGNECDRKIGVEHRNSDINKNRTYLNESYKDCHNGFYSEFHQLLSVNRCEFMEKKTSIAFEGMIITTDLAFFEKMRYNCQEEILDNFTLKNLESRNIKNKPPKEVRAFFDEAYKWALETIGYDGTDRNIISAKVHYDEKTPHMHIYYIPMTNQWQEKVYAKDADGKVLRNAKGSPIQAKDGKGKTVYRQVTSETPKLSRTEFWKNRGGKNSYRQMQDDFQDVIGRKYGLERGEIGSTREHETKHQYKQRELETELKPLQAMKAKTDRIEEKKTTIPLTGKTIVSTAEWTRTVEQAKAYCVNSDEIKDMRKTRKEIEKLQSELAEREKILHKMELETAEAYRRQQGINRVLEQTEKALATERSNNAVLRAENEAKVKSLSDAEKRSSDALNALNSVVKATGMLKYGKSGGYKVENLTLEQERLIDAVANYGIEIAKKAERNDLAEEMEKKVGIILEIKSEINKLTPQERSFGRGGR